jgi:peptidyl-prolyl cis-trans isomerase SurA
MQPVTMILMNLNARFHQLTTSSGKSMLSHAIAVAFFLFMFFGVSGQDQVVLDKVLAQVGSEVILQSDVEEFYAYQKANYGKMPPDARCVILDNLLLKALLVSEAKLDTLIIVSDDEVEDQLNRRIDEILAMMNGDASFFQEYYGKSINEVKTEMRDDIRNQSLGDRMQQKVVTDTKITPAEVKDFFEQIPRDSLPYFSSEVEISEIVRFPSINAEERKKAFEKLEKLKQRIVDGDDFAFLAKTYSDDPGSARNGGDLGWQKRGNFVQEFEEAAYRLDEGELSPIIESSFGLHLIQMLERRGNSFHTRHILIRPAITEDDIERTRKTLDSVRTEVLDGRLPFELAVKRFSDKEVQSFNNGGRLTNPKSGNTFFEVADLEPDVFFVIDSLKPAGISAPIRFRREDDKVGYRLILLNSRSSPHKANLQQDFSKIKAAALEKKRNESLNNWIKDKVETAYIAIDPAYQHCSILERWMPGKVGQKP